MSPDVTAPPSPSPEAQPSPSPEAPPPSPETLPSPSPQAVPSPSPEAPPPPSPQAQPPPSPEAPPSPSPEAPPPSPSPEAQLSPLLEESPPPSPKTSSRDPPAPSPEAEPVASPDQPPQLSPDPTDDDEPPPPSPDPTDDDESPPPSPRLAETPPPSPAAGESPGQPEQPSPDSPADTPEVPPTPAPEAPPAPAPSASPDGNSNSGGGSDDDELPAPTPAPSPAVGTSGGPSPTPPSPNVVDDALCQLTGCSGDAPAPDSQSSPSEIPSTIVDIIEDELESSPTPLPPLVPPPPLDPWSGQLLGELGAAAAPGPAPGPAPLLDLKEGLLESLNATLDLCVAMDLNCEVCTTPEGCASCPDGYLLMHFTAEDTDEEAEPAHCREPCADPRCLDCQVSEDSGADGEVCLRCAPGYVAAGSGPGCLPSGAGGGWARPPANVSDEGREALLDFTDSVAGNASSGADADADAALVPAIQMAIEQTASANGSVGLLAAVEDLMLPPDYFSSPLSVVDGLDDVLATLAADPGFEESLAGRDAAAAGAQEAARIAADWNKVAREFPDRAADARLAGGTEYEDDTGFLQVVQGQNRLAVASNAALLYNPGLGPAARAYFESLGRAARLAGATTAITPQQQEEVVEGQNTAISAALAPPWGSTARRRLRQANVQTSLPEDISTEGYASQGQQRLAVAAQQNGGTMPYNHQSLLHINSGQNRLIAQAEEQMAAAETDPMLSPEVRAQLRSDAQDMRKAAILNGGSHNVLTSSEQAALSKGVELLLDTLTSTQNNIIRSVARSDLAEEEVVAVERWARENGGDAAVTLQELYQSLAGLNRLAVLADVKWYEAQAAANIGQMSWAFHLGRKARRRGASVAHTPEAVCDSLAGLQVVEEKYGEDVEGSKVLLDELQVNISTVGNPIKPSIDAVMQRRDRGRHVQTLQSLLLWLGYYTGTPDGYYGEATHNAVADAMAALRLLDTSADPCPECYVYNGTVDNGVWRRLWAHWFSACGQLLDDTAGDVIVDAYRSHAAALRRRHPNATISFYALPPDPVAPPFDALGNGTWYDFVEAIEMLDCTDEEQEETDGLAAVLKASAGEVANTVTGRGAVGESQEGRELLFAHYADPRTYLTFHHLAAFQRIAPASADGQCDGGDAWRAVDSVLAGTFMAASKGDEKGVLAAASYDNYTSLLLEAGEMSNVSSLYLAVRARLEAPASADAMLPGPLARGFPCPSDASLECFNFFGLVALNESEAMCLDELAKFEAQAALAEEQGWFSEIDAIIGGAQWMAENWDFEAAPTPYHQTLLQWGSTGVPRISGALSVLFEAYLLTEAGGMCGGEGSAPELLLPLYWGLPPLAPALYEE